MKHLLGLNGVSEDEITQILADAFEMKKLLQNKKISSQKRL